MRWPWDAWWDLSIACIRTDMDDACVQDGFNAGKPYYSRVSVSAY